MCALALAILAAAFTVAAAQPAPITIPAAPTCTNCTIELTKVATVGKADDPVLLLTYSRIHRGPGRTFITTNGIGATSVVLFDSAGRFTRQIGGRGQGPGEFSGPAFFVGVGRGDSAHFRDQGRRHSIFTPSLDFARLLQLEDPFTSITLALPNGAYLATIRPGATLRPGPRPPYDHSLELISPQGAVVRKFGAVEAEESDACVPCSSRYVSTTRDRTGFWVVRRNRYAITRYSLDGEPTLSFVVDRSPWMTAWTIMPTAPFSYLEDVREAPGDRLVVIGRSPAAGTTQFIRANTTAWDVRREQTLSTVIDVIDLRRRVVLTSRRFEKEVYTFLDHDHVVRQRESAEGIFSFDVYRIEVRER